MLRILDTATALVHRLDGALAHTLGVSYSEYRLLRALGQAGEAGLTRIALAQMVSLSPSGVTRALKPLEKLGFVVTVKSARDARQSLARLTRTGTQLIANADGILRDVYRDLDVIQSDEPQLEHMLRLLTHLGTR